MAEFFQCGVILLAAGGSRRMGMPKQLLPIGGIPLVRHVAQQLLDGPVIPVVIVLGAEAEKIQPVLADLPVHLAINTAWADGLSSSLQVGIQAMLAIAPAVPAVIVALADQPAIPPHHVAQLIARFQQGGCTAVASTVEAESVPPLLFGKSWFEKLTSLSGDTGARALLREHPEEIATVPLATNADLDTPEDYRRFTADVGGI